ncbi:HpcH/HpaI aldolase family protein [Microvirga tunisiensis]|uniref:2,4-dihydroxyhept-2-ene-1,7-dioic acid aldolase n=1 Tax=Microvirga tunisiensis TaxID=2108360 RepID=A0A5N7MXD0_9HYPH|nr:aldolase/citrate lyase family protein [Microvirga tunisiensis]MPR10608.1 2,4-dihydroxyhept-2-ene-1,7-dioic acid aldolase [Microvirga tunisiensis]MPR28736.1 2,4-dihydroxyhept-2-ene-1,7-dioic acid aldolase [Microvirga tunisiensis]
MLPNGIRAQWSAGKPVINGWLSIACPFTAEIMAAQGYDSITIDLQHGLIGYEVATTMLQAMRASAVTPLVRVPWLDPAAIMKSLDAGAYGVICPMINTREEAERLVSYVRYPPDGMRSFGPTRANFSAGADYGQHADAEVLCFAMIEAADAVANLDAIVSTPGLDGVYIGPADLTLGLSGRRYPTGFDREEPEIVEVIQTILHKAHKAGIRACLHNGTPTYGAKAIGWGFDLVTISNDVRLLAGAAQASVATARKLIADQEPSPAATATGGY